MFGGGVRVLQDVSGGDADGADVVFREEGVAASIGDEVVLLAVDLDAEAIAGPVEVQDVGTERVLAAEATAANAAPDQHFGQGQGSTETSGAFLGKDRRSHGTHHNHKLRRWQGESDPLP